MTSATLRQSRAAAPERRDGNESRAATALRQSQLPALRRLAVRETEASVVIVGRVHSYYLKQMAQEAVMPVLAGRQLVNHVLVAKN